MSFKKKELPEISEFKLGYGIKFVKKSYKFRLYCPWNLYPYEMIDIFLAITLFKSS